jgi:hypothetical protein
MPRHYRDRQCFNRKPEGSSLLQQACSMEKQFLPGVVSYIGCYLVDFIFRAN